jgi:hypothetical protein
LALRNRVKASRTSAGVQGLMDFFGADTRPDLTATPVFAARFGRRFAATLPDTALVPLTVGVLRFEGCAVIFGMIRVY